VDALWIIERLVRAAPTVGRGAEFVDGAGVSWRTDPRVDMSLDGCTKDEHGPFDWAPPDDDVFVFITEPMRSAGTSSMGGACARPWLWGWSTNWPCFVWQSSRWAHPRAADRHTRRPEAPDEHRFSSGVVHLAIAFRNERGASLDSTRAPILRINIFEALAEVPPPSFDVEGLVVA
jgi:hypothetical protein